MHILHGGPQGPIYALYGAREPLPAPPLQFSDEDHVRSFIEPYWQTPGTTEVFRRALIAQGIVPLPGRSTLFAQTAHSLQTGQLRVAPVAVSGLRPVQTEPAKPAFSGKPYVPPRRENPRPTPTPQARTDYKIVVEVGGKPPLSLVTGHLELSRSALADRWRTSWWSDTGADSHRIQTAFSGLTQEARGLWLVIPAAGGGIRKRLCTSVMPVPQDARQNQWPTVLVPVVPLGWRESGKPASIAPLAPGWIYVYVDSHLWREVRLDGMGMMRDVDFTTTSHCPDQRLPHSLPQSLLLLPHKLNGREARVEVAYSRRQWTWTELCAAGGFAPDDPGLTDSQKQHSVTIAVDSKVQTRLQALDLSGYAQTFAGADGAVRALDDAPTVGCWHAPRRDRLQGLRGHRLAALYLREPPRKKQVVPVIYVPGIFGSRLENSAALRPEDKYGWDPDDQSGIVKAYAKSKWSALIARDWTDKDIGAKTMRLHSPDLRIMTGHAGDLRDDAIQRIKSSPVFVAELRRHGSLDDDEIAEIVYQRQSQRGWYGVLCDYEPLLEAIDAVEDEDFIHVTYAVGMDWRGDLRDAAQRLKGEIERIKAITDHPELGAKGVDYEAGTAKVLIVTHSQGSLIARYASEVLGANANIQGIVHLNQPTTGAPVLYRRFLGGARPEREPWYKLSKLPDNVFAEILGTTSYHFTRMAAMAGAFCLLPTNDYRHRAGANNGDWLKCPPALKPETIADIYDDVYRSDSVGLICHKRYDAQGNPKPYTAQEFEKVWYHDALGYFYDVLLSRVDRSRVPQNAHTYLPEETPWHHDNMRLKLIEALPKKERKPARDWLEKFEKNLRAAQSFHADLGLKHHPNTHVIRSNGLNTVTHVRLELSPDKNGDTVLECPYERTKDGDGTVPLTSQEALLTQNAKSAGPIITAGHVVHADICKHPEAIGHTKTAIHTLVNGLRPKNQDRAHAS